MALDHHLSLSLAHALWEDLLRRALPVKLAAGEFDVADLARDAVRRLELRQRVAGLLEDRRPPTRLVKLGQRARGAWKKNREALYKRVDDVILVEGTWRVELDDAGTDLRYGPQQVTADATLKATAEGTVRLLGRNVEIPFSLSRRVGASVVLGDIRFSASDDAVVGSLRDLALHLGESRTVELLSRLAERALEPRLDAVNPLPILRRDQLEGLVGPLGGPLRLNMGVERMDLQVDADSLTLKVRFGFTQRQLESEEDGF
jgi:hypothetical protein